jgi:hypothetical protein
MSFPGKTGVRASEAPLETADLLIRNFFLLAIFALISLGGLIYWASELH